MNVFTKQRNIPVGEKSGGIIALILFVVIIFVWGYVFFSGGSSPSIPKPHVPGAIELHVQAQQFVKKALKAPTTAEFPWEPVSAGTDGTGLYQVESYVDSQNSFGAMVRSEWMVNMRLSGDRWTLEKMRIGGKIVYDIESDNTK